MAKDSVRISYSAVRDFKACPQKYYNGRKYRSKTMTSAFPFGKAVEKGVDLLIMGKTLEEAHAEFEKHWEFQDFGSKFQEDVYDNPLTEYYQSDLDTNLFNDADWEQIDDWAEEIYEEGAVGKEELDGCVKDIKSKKRLSKIDQKFYNRAAWLACMVRGYLMIEAFRDQILPEIEEIIEIDGKVALQQKVSMKNEDGDEIVGYPDYVVRIKGVEKPVILDLKTASTAYVDHAIKTSDQLKTYAAALHEVLGDVAVGYAVLIKRIGIDKRCDKCNHLRESGVAKNCKKCKGGKYKKHDFNAKTQLLIQEFDFDELEDTLEEYMNIALAIKHKVNFKNPTNCHAYGRVCEYYQACWGKQKLEDLENLKKREDKK